MPQSRITRQDIVRYYDRCEVDYRWLWDLDASHAMHLGYWDETTTTLRDALARMNEILAARARIGASDLVLDAGCGVGGSGLFLAQRFGCQVVGITLSPKQAASARARARRYTQDGRVRVAVENFTRMGFKDRSFDVVWALESVCYAENKRDFVREASRVLNDGGRLVLADGFATKERYSAEERRLLRKWLHNWAVPRLETADTFADFLLEAGFTNVHFKDITAAVLPSSFLIYLHSLYGLPFGRIAESLGLRERVQTRNIIGARYQYIVTRQRLARYGLFWAEKGPGLAAQPPRAQRPRKRGARTAVDQRA